MNASLTVDATKANDPAMRELFSSLNKKVLVCQLGSLYMPLSVAAEIHARPVMQRQLPARNSADWLIRRQMSRGMISIDQNCLFCAVHVNMHLLLAAEEQGGLRRITRFFSLAYEIGVHEKNEDDLPRQLLLRRELCQPSMIARA